jgi:hypothetical protein
MEQRSGFPPAGFLILGVLSLASAIIYLIRAFAVEATAERMWSTALFALVGVFWIWAYRDADTGRRT